MESHSITAIEFVDKYVRGELDDQQIIDVREPYEWDMYHLDKAKLIPMNTIPEQMEQLAADKTIFILCAHGVRSWHVTHFLLNQGLTNVVNVEGGMAEVYPQVRALDSSE